MFRVLLTFGSFVGNFVGNFVDAIYDRKVRKGARKVRAAGTRRGPAQRAVPRLAALRAFAYLLPGLLAGIWARSGGN